MNFRSLLTILVLTLISAVFCEATLTPSSRKNNKNSAIKNQVVGPQDTTVFGLKLVTDEPTPKQILQYNRAFFKETDEYKFDGLVLGFVTPVILKIKFFISLKNAL